MLTANTPMSHVFQRAMRSTPNAPARKWRESPSRTNIALKQPLGDRADKMTGLETINATPVWLLASLVIGVCVVFSVGLQLLVRWIFGVEFIATNHEVAGFKYAVVGLSLIHI